jgi:hypothetical protein
LHIQELTPSYNFINLGKFIKFIKSLSKGISFRKRKNQSSAKASILGQGEVELKENAKAQIFNEDKEMSTRPVVEPHY